MCSANLQQIYRRTPLLKCDFSKVANQHYSNYTSVWVFSCKFASLYSIQIHAKFGLFSNIFLAILLFSSEWAVLCLLEFSLFLYRLIPCEQYFVTFCWIVFLHDCAWLNIVKMLLELLCSFFFWNIFYNKTLFFLDIWGIVTLNLLQKRHFWILFISILSPQAV